MNAESITQMRYKQGSTNYNILNHSKKSFIIPSSKKPESLGKVFDFQRATYHNYRQSHKEAVLENENVFRRSQGEFTKFLNAGQSHSFINPKVFESTKLKP